MRVCGYDISHYQEKSATSFHDAYNAGFILAICKATEGMNWADPCYHGFIQRLNTIDGQLAGAYHFGTDADGIGQADHFLNVAGSIPLLCLDWEPSGQTMTLSQAEAFVSRVQDRRGKWPMLYGGSLIKETRIPKTSPLLNCELWLSQYADSLVLPPQWGMARLWQSSGDGEGPEPHNVPGVGTNIDINRFPGTKDDLRRWYASL